MTRRFAVAGINKKIMTDDALMKVAVGVAALAVAGALFTAAIGISKPQAVAKPSVSSNVSPTN
jgi:hypothetical protein